MNNVKPFSAVKNIAKTSYMDFIQRHWRWIASLCILILILPLFTPAGYFFWGLSSAKTLFRDELGFGESIATVFAVAFMFVYTLAIPYAARWLTIGRRRPSDVGIAFLSVLFVFGSKPLLTGILGSSFNTQTGAAQKCYSWRGGAITLSEKGSSGCGIDPLTGQPRSELTRDIAAILERQQHLPKSIPIDGTPIQFFDPSSGRPTVWYDRAPDGSLELFDAEGFNPNTGKKLTAITAEIAATVHMKRENQTTDEGSSPPLLSTQLKVDENIVRAIPSPGLGAECPPFNLQVQICRIGLGGATIGLAANLEASLVFCITPDIAPSAHNYKKIYKISTNGEIIPYDINNLSQALGYILIPNKSIIVRYLVARDAAEC